jgi:hypothetical protein
LFAVFDISISSLVVGISRVGAALPQGGWGWIRMPAIAWVFERRGANLAPAGIGEPLAGDVDRRRHLVAVVERADPGGTFLVVSKPHGAVWHSVQGQRRPQPDAERTSRLEVHDRNVHGGSSQFIIVKL